MSEQASEPARIPVEVKHEDLMAALQPLSELLNVDLKGIYADPPITIGGRTDDDFVLGHITFTVPPRGIGSEPLRDTAHPQGDEHAELRCLVSVDIVP